MIGSGVLVTIKQWTTQGNFNRYNAPPPPTPTREFFIKGTIERTVRYPTINIIMWDVWWCVCNFYFAGGHLLECHFNLVISDLFNA